MNRIKIILEALLICIAIILVVLFLTKWSANKHQDAAIVLQIKTLNRWETSSYTVEQIIDNGASGNVFQQILFGNRILLIAHGTVTAGFDLSVLKDNSVDINGKNVTVNLPAAQILSTSLDESQTRVYDRQKGLLVASDDNLESDARAQAVTKIREAACSGGVLNTATDNAKKQLTSMLQSLGFISITVNSPGASCK